MLASSIFSDLPASPREAAGHLLGHLRVRQQTINLSSLILRFRDCDLLEVDIEGDGYCLPAGMLSDKTLVVIPSKGQGEERRRFTLAHELGHLACHYNTRRGSIDEERWCDTFASELLMPEARVTAFAQSVTTLSDWFKFPQHFKVSRPAAARQLWDYCRVVMITEKLNARPDDARYVAIRRELNALSVAGKMIGDTFGKLGDGTACLVRQPPNQGYIAVARLDDCPNMPEAGSIPAA
jgi:hypothetical protein